MKSTLFAVIACCFFLSLCGCNGTCGNIPTPPDAVLHWPIGFQSKPDIRPSGYVIAAPQQTVMQAMPVAVPQPAVQYIQVAPAAATPCR